MPCNIFPKIYGLIDKSVFDVMLNTCSKTDIPPKPNKKEVKIIFIESFLQAIVEKEEMPFVISIKPLSRGKQNDVSIFNKLKIGFINVEQY